MSSLPHIANHEQFTSEVLGNQGVVIVDFFADRCGPCRMVAPIMEQIAEEYKDKNVTVVKVDVDENQETAMKYEVMSIPTVYIFHKGEQAGDPIVGVDAKAVYTDRIDQLLAA